MYFPCSVLMFTTRLMRSETCCYFQVGPAVAAAAAGATAAAAQQPDLSLPLRPNSRTTSAPTSPAKSRESLLQRVSSLTSNVVSNVSRVTSAQIQQQQQTAESGKLPYNKDRCFTLLVIDDQNTDWYWIGPARNAHESINKHAFSFLSVWNNNSVVRHELMKVEVFPRKTDSRRLGCQSGAGGIPWTIHHGLNWQRGHCFHGRLPQRHQSRQVRFLANSPLLLRQLVSKWPAKIEFLFLGVSRLCLFSLLPNFSCLSRDSQVNEYESPFVCGCDNDGISNKTKGARSIQQKNSRS